MQNKGTFDKINISDFESSKAAMVPFKDMDEAFIYRIQFMTVKRGLVFTAFKALAGKANVERLDETDMPILLNLRSNEGPKVESLDVNVSEEGLILPASHHTVMISRNQNGPKFLAAYLLPKE